MFRIYVDVKVTRRQRLHHVMDEDSLLMFSAPDIGACIDWCVDHGEIAVGLVVEQRHGDDRMYYLPLRFSVTPFSIDPPHWDD